MMAGVLARSQQIGEQHRDGRDDRGREEGTEPVVGEKHESGRRRQPRDEGECSQSHDLAVGETKGAQSRREQASPAARARIVGGFPHAAPIGAAQALLTPAANLGFAPDAV